MRSPRPSRPWPIRPAARSWRGWPRRAATVGELAEPFDMSLPAVSRHLKVLTEAGLIERSTEAQWRRCALRGEGLRAAADWIEFYRRFWEQQFDQLDAFLKRTAPKAPKPAKTNVPKGEAPWPPLLTTRPCASCASSTRRANACSTPGPSQEQFIQWLCPPRRPCLRGEARRAAGRRLAPARAQRVAQFRDVGQVCRGQAARAPGLHLGASRDGRSSQPARPRDDGAPGVPRAAATRPSSP